MPVQPSDASSPIQRIQVTVEPTKRAKISVEAYDNSLGWYTAASLSIPLHQLPLLEQAIERIRQENQPEYGGEKIVRFPGLG